MDNQNEPDSEVLENVQGSDGVNAASIGWMEDDYGGGIFPEEASDFFEAFIRENELESEIPEVVPPVNLEEEPPEDELDERPLLDDDISAYDPLLLENSDVNFLNRLNACCKCNLKCNEKFHVDDIRSSFDAGLELDFYCDQNTNHHHLLLLGGLNALCNADVDTSSNKKLAKQRNCVSIDYMFRGRKVCQSFYLFAHACGIRKWNGVKEHFIENGTSSKHHGNLGKSSTLKSLPVDMRSNAVLFIKSFSQQHGLVLPGRVPAHRNLDLVILPSSMTKKHVHEQYEEACSTREIQPVKIKMWYSIWTEFCSSIVIQKPRSDLCPQCQSNMISVGNMQGLSEADKFSRLTNSLEHLTRVKEERSHYNNLCSHCAELVASLNPQPVIGRNMPCSLEITMHISFDYAQQIHLPHSPQQVGPLYFLCGYKVGLFGIALEPVGKFILYIIPESCTTGKGSNVVISLIHHYFQNFGFGEKIIHCHADNCSGQNKNNYLLQYGAWRVATGLHEAFNISFLPVGHTKFSPDLYFGLFKKCFARHDANSFQDLIEIAHKSCPSAKSIIPVLVGDELGELSVPTLDWQAFFGTKKAQRIPGMLKYHHFGTSTSAIGKIRCKKSINDAETEFKVFPSNFDPKDYPSAISPVGLSFARKKYLFEKIREYVYHEPSKDILCPDPGPEPVEEKDEDVDTDKVVSTEEASVVDSSSLGSQQPSTSSASQDNQSTPLSHETPKVPSTSISDNAKAGKDAVRKRRVAKCGHCGEEGHINRQRPDGTFTCPNRS